MLKVIAWILYVVCGLVVAIVAFSESAWFGLAVVLALVFGPKLWKAL